MPDNPGATSQRKKEHIEICLTDDAAFNEKTNGFDKYDFIHCAVTEVIPSEINFDTEFLAKKIKYPFLISCMTGGTASADNINEQLAEAANDLSIPLGVGSQRQALENADYHKSYKVIRQRAPGIPVLGNIGAAQITKINTDRIKSLVDLVEADAMVVHLNPLQELIQKNGEPEFRGLLASIENLVKNIPVPVIVKEVGSGISRSAAMKLLECGVYGIDVAGAGGTSWSAVEVLRNKDDNGKEFWNWGLPTSYCIRTVYELKQIFGFVLIGSGGINSALDAAKAFALGADLTASARIILQTLDKAGPAGVEQLVHDWFGLIRNILYLTGSQNLMELRNNKLLRKEELY